MDIYKNLPAGLSSSLTGICVVLSVSFIFLFSLWNSILHVSVVPERLLRKDLLLLEKSLFEHTEALRISLFGLNA